MQLGSDMSVASITHEIGHAFDRIGGLYSLDRAMASNGDPLLVSPTGIPGTNPPIHVAPASQFQNLPADAESIFRQHGMTGRARGLDTDCQGDKCPNTTGGEIFPDMFMNWVLGGAQPYHFHPGDIREGQPGWDGTMYGTAKAAYVAQAVLDLINGTGSAATPAATQGATATPYPPALPSNSSFVNQLNQAIQAHVVGNYQLP